MSNHSRDGGGAFPLSDARQPGMSLRDYFAGQVLIALVHKQPLLDREGEHGPKFDDAQLPIFRRDMAIVAYEYADAMIAARGGGS